MQEGDFVLSFSIFLLLFCVYTVQVLCAGKSNEGVVQVLLDPVHVLQLPPLNHKYWSLSYSYPHPPSISQVLVPVQQLPPLYHQHWSLSCRLVLISRQIVARCSHVFSRLSRDCRTTFIRQLYECREIFAL